MTETYYNVVAFETTERGTCEVREYTDCAGYYIGPATVVYEGTEVLRTESLVEAITWFEELVEAAGDEQGCQCGCCPEDTDDEYWARFDSLAPKG